jgi:hypothetical protein
MSTSSVDISRSRAAPSGSPVCCAEITMGFWSL